MKTRFFPLFVICGIVASSGLVARAIESNPTQPSDSASAVPASATPQFSGRINDVVSLSKSGVDPSIVLAFIKNSPGPFEPSADEIIKLRDMGVSTPVLTAMLQRGAEVRDQAHAAAMSAAPDANTSPAQAPVITETPPNTPSGSDGSDYAAQQPGSTVTYVGGDSSYPYPYPNYYYSGYYASPFFYPFPCWFGGVFFAHGCFFPHGGFVHDGFHVHDGGFHGGDGHGGFHAGVSGGFHAGVSSGFHSGVNSGFHAGVTTGFHSGTVSAGGFHSGVSSVGGMHSMPVGGGFHSGMVNGGFHGSAVGGFHGGAIGGGGGFHGGMGGGGGGFHGGGGGGGHR